jgi:polyisoprenoid-binding protein YceI
MKAVVALGLFGSSLLAQAARYEIQPTSNSRLALEVYKTGFMSGKKHVFLFERYAGTLDYDAKAPQNSRVELSIESASLVLTDTWLSKDDMRKVREHAETEMLVIGKFPRIQFSSNKVTRSPDGSFEVAGNLTIREKTMPVTTTVKLTGDPGDTLRFTGKAEVKLRDYGLKPPSALLGAISTKNEMTLEFVLFARPRAAP